MNKLFQVTLFLVNGPRYDLSVFIAYIRSFLTGTKRKDITVYSPQELIEKLVNGKSIIRFGDGEAMLMIGRDVHYQKTSPELNAELRKIVTQYNSESPFILAIPVEALTSNDGYLHKKGRLRIWRLFRCFAEKRLTSIVPYADAHSFYRQSFLTEALPRTLQGKHVICVSKAKTLDNILKQYLDKYALSVSFIESPDHNSFEQLSSLTKMIESNISVTPESTIVLLAIGPASKVLTLHLLEKNLQCLDIGHGLEIVGRNEDYSDKI